MSTTSASSSNGSVVITGATGHLGRLVVEDLLGSGVDPERIVATGRSIDKLADLAERGVVVRRLDFDDPETLNGALSAGDRVLLVSGSEIGNRPAQHQAVIDAAVAADVAQLAYTSGPKARTNPMKLMTDHRLTEEAIEASGVPATILRNGWYFENYTDQLGTYLEHGAILGSAGDARISAAARVDFAAAAAVVLTGPVDDHVGRVYELGGDTTVTLTDLAAAITAATGQTVVYADMSAADHFAALLGAGLPEAFAEILVDVDQSAAGGALEVEGHELSALIGRPTTSLIDAVAAATATA
jgi:NAD(P)H dehydrogenase (quinone)